MTTIKVTSATLKKLKFLKVDWDAKSVEEVVAKLIAINERIEK